MLRPCYEDHESSLQDTQFCTAASQGPERVDVDRTSTASCSDQLWEMLHESICSLTQAAPSANVLQSVRNLLEDGDVVHFSLPIFETYMGCIFLKANDEPAMPRVFKYLIRFVTELPMINVMLRRNDSAM